LLKAKGRRRFACWYCGLRTAEIFNVKSEIHKSFRTESITKYMVTKINTRWEATQRLMAQNSLDWLTK